MIKQCAIPHCGEATGGHSTLCERHKRTQRRHGHPEQIGVTVHELSPFRKRVGVRRVKNADSPAWPLLAKRWQVVVQATASTVADYHSGSVHDRYAVIAAQQVQLIATLDAPEAVVETALAMYLLGDDRPNRFRSDRAFSFELARRVRGLADGHAGTYWDAKTKSLKRVYRDLPPRAIEVLGAHLVAAFGGAGVFLARLEGADAASAMADRKNLAAALGALK